jgi:hypothetical protein
VICYFHFVANRVSVNRVSVKRTLRVRNPRNIVLEELVTETNMLCNGSLSLWNVTVIIVITLR